MNTQDAKDKIKLIMKFSLLQTNQVWIDILEYFPFVFWIKYEYCYCFEINFHSPREKKNYNTVNKSVHNLSIQYVSK